MQIGGGDAIDFELFPYTDRRAQRFGVHQCVFMTWLSQPSSGSGGNIAQRLENGLRRAMLRQVLNGKEEGDDCL